MSTTTGSHKRGKFLNAEKRLYKQSASDAVAASRWNTCTGTPTGTPAIQELPEEVIFKITAHLDAKSLLRFRQTNKFWARLAAKNEAGWRALCVSLWTQKVHVCPQAKALHASANDNSAINQTACLRAYRDSCHDAAVRHNIWPQHEFLYDTQTRKGTIWYFRFKEAAGADWTQLDPWYAGGSPRKLIFLQNGTAQPYVQHDNTTAMDDPLVAPMRWRFITRPMDLPTRPLGSYVRITVGGRDVPTYAVRRSPTNNWGFVMESCWGLFASFPLPPRQQTNGTPPPHMELFNSPHHRRLRRTSDGQPQWIMPDRADEEHHENNQETRTTDLWDLLRDDAHLLITNETQWREAFLYNVGARILPEGDEATDDFDRAWGGLGV